MRAISLLIIFAFSLVLVLFSLENTQSVTIQLAPQVELQAPLCIALFAAMGVGALLALLSSIWFRLLVLLENRKTAQMIREKDQRIQALEKDLQQYKAETPNEPLKLPPATSSELETSDGNVETVPTSSVN
ncbi:LapA family protein [Phormidium sp. LEGE 05292]|uniref:lipopolysaccharide assembly protein LapA domain-containing protein n=1 Tax=[Phormidium] sp. LEGE 05292 TaxID=767427 RepID=UPI001880549D|nr:LapA family protein [Phormidium sp. LEGE 05292]MBE9230037.1 LapA family protein [Phormidium sp. LEGE 05292]